MPNSLKAKFDSLRHKDKITDEELEELKRKLYGHDKVNYQKVLSVLILRANDYLCRAISTYGADVREAYEDAWLELIAYMREEVERIEKIRNEFK